jgi:hypothetical protein
MFRSFSLQYQLYLYFFICLIVKIDGNPTDTEMPPQSPLASLVARAESPLPDEGDSMKQITEKKTRKVVAKKKCGNQGEVQPSVTVGRHTPGPQQMT